MNRMLIVGRVREGRWSSSGSDKLRLYRLDNKAIKDATFSDWLAAAEKLDIGNIDDFRKDTVAALYPTYVKGSSKVEYGDSACYVLGAHGSGGYVCLRPHGGNKYIQVIPRSRLVQDVKKGRMHLINAVIEMQGNSDTISPIAGEWEDMSHLMGRTLAAGTDSTGVEDGVDRPDARDKIAAGDTVDSHDELGMLTPAQKNFLKEYYIEFSVEAFNRIAGKTSWKMKEGKTEKLVELRKMANGENWRFAGMWDSGRMGGGKCEFGHKLRYVYMACPVSHTFAMASKAGTLLNFGIVCHSDFLEIPKEDVARLGKLQSTMCDEIKFISTILANNDVESHNVLMDSMLDLLGRLEGNGKLETVLGERLAVAYRGFKEHQLPFVESVVLDIQRGLEKCGWYGVLRYAGLDMSNFSKEVKMLHDIDGLPIQYSDVEKHYFACKDTYDFNKGVRALRNKVDTYDDVLAKYAELFIANDVCGEYMYIPNAELTEFRKGDSDKYYRYGLNDKKLGLNDRTRELRNAWMEYFKRNTYERTTMLDPNGGSVRVLTMQGLDGFNALVSRLYKAGKSIEAAIGADKISEAVEQCKSDSYSSDPSGYFRLLMKTEELKPKLLVAALSDVTPLGKLADCRRMAAGYIKSQSELIELLDETKDGTDPAYLEMLKECFLLPTKDVLRVIGYVGYNDKRTLLSVLEAVRKAEAERLEKEKNSVEFDGNKWDTRQGNFILRANYKRFPDSYSPTQKEVAQYSSLDDAKEYINRQKSFWRSRVFEGVQVVDLSTMELVYELGPDELKEEAVVEAVRAEVDKQLAPENVAKAQKETADMIERAKTDAAQGTYRGDAKIAKELADKFDALSKNMPAELADDRGIKIAADIIKRFRGKLGESEGFTRKETWRVENEIKRLEAAAK